MIIKPCPVCGAKHDGPFWGSVIEFSTRNEQTCYMACSECSLGCSITIDPDSLREGDAAKIEAQLFQVWNNFDRFIKRESSND